MPVLLLGPEAALRRNIADALIEAAKDGAVEYGLNAKLTHFFVDEAHIIESWGRGFRPDFQRLPGFLNRLRGVDPTIRLVLLSATLSPAARQVLRDGWSGDRPWLEIDARVPRYEHDVVVEHFNSPEARLEALAWTLDRAPRPAIVYTTEVEHAKAIHHWLSEERGFRRTALFTGETASTERRSIVDRWAGDELDLVVATSAFGMGVDKADVRSVVHACLPEGPARWYQEIGRAARDGGQGLAVLLFTVMRGEDDDVDRARGLAVGGWLTRDLAEKRWAALMRDARTKEWVSDRFHMTVDLDSVRAGLKPRSSDYNRGWNMALLTLLQRAGAIEIRSVSGGDDVIGKVWDLTILDNGLLDDAVDSWDRVFETRQMEVDRAREEVKPFIQLTERPTKACVTATFNDAKKYGMRTLPGMPGRTDYAARRSALRGARGGMAANTNCSWNTAKRLAPDRTQPPDVRARPVGSRQGVGERGHRAVSRTGRSRAWRCRHTGYILVRTRARAHIRRMGR